MSKVNVVIYGTNGLLFKPVTDALINKFSEVVNFPIRALTRDASKKTSDDKIKYYTTNVDDLETFKEPFENADVYINLTAFVNWEAPLEAVQKYNVPLKLYIGPQFGSELDRTIYSNTGITAKFDHTNSWRAKGHFKVVDLVTSLFVTDFVNSLGLFDFNKETNELTVYGEETDKFDVSFLPDVGNAVAALVKKGAEEGFTTLKERIRISSSKISYNDIIAKYEKNNNVKVVVKREPREKLLNESLEKAKTFSWNDFLYYLKAITAAGEDKGNSWSTNDDEYLNPNESLFKWTRY